MEKSNQDTFKMCQNLFFFRRNWVATCYRLPRELKNGID